MDIVKSLGVDEVFDYRETDIHSLGRTFDAVIDYSGVIDTLDKATSLLKLGGQFISTIPSPSLMNTVA